MVDLRADGTVALADRKDAIRPGNARRAGIRRVLREAADHFPELVALWGKCMTKRTHRVVTTNDQIDAAIAGAKTFEAGDRRVRKAEYEADADRICLYLADGIGVSIPRKYLQGLQNAKRAQLSEIEIVGNGTGLHWPRLDVDHYVLGLLNQVFGTKQWMAHLGRLGGASRSKAKGEAARANGRMGGRPRKNLQRQSVAPKRLAITNRSLENRKQAKTA